MDYTVLIIDDDAAQGATILGRLKEVGPEPASLTWCKSYEEAFGPLFSGRWDIVLINLGRSQGNGAEVVERVKGLLSEEPTRTVIYTHGQEAYRKEGTGIVSREELTRPGYLRNLLTEARQSMDRLQS